MARSPRLSKRLISDHNAAASIASPFAIARSRSLRAVSASLRYLRYRSIACLIAAPVPGKLVPGSR